MCKSACENMFAVCGFSEDMYRCGDAEFFNAYAMENPSGTSKWGEPVSKWKRDFFPGQPFKKNEFLPGKDPKKPKLDVCTPSFFGAAERRTPGILTLAAVGLGVVGGLVQLL